MYRQNGTFAEQNNASVSKENCARNPHPPFSLVQRSLDTTHSHQLIRLVRFAYICGVPSYCMQSERASERYTTAYVSVCCQCSAETEKTRDLNTALIQLCRIAASPQGAFYSTLHTRTPTSNTTQQRD